MCTGRLEQLERLEESRNVGRTALVLGHAGHVTAGLDVGSASVISDTLQ